MDLDFLDQLLSRMRGADVVAVGDVMVDRFVYGDVTRVSAEAPIPILTRRRASTMLGGCGNVARNVAALGGRARLVGVVGQDPDGAEARRLAAEEPMIEAHLIEDPHRPTTIKTRFVSGGQQLLRVDDERPSPVEQDVERVLAETLRSECAGARAVLISDYGKGVMTERVVGACQAAARVSGAIIVVDSKARAFDRYGPVDIIKPNAKELSEVTGLPADSDQEIELALARALALSEARAILATRSAKGMSLAMRGQPVRHFRLRPPEVFDTAGAGDTALAALGLALAAGASTEEAVSLALIASHLVVEKAGVATVTPAEILEWRVQAGEGGPAAKLASPERMVGLVERWREQGLRVGFTNGCFDILHPGHISCLSQARSWCDRLIVGLNTDDSVRAAKGPDRPVNTLEARARVLAALSCVDLVVPFAEPTPIGLITRARPDVLVKGGDYTVESVVGADLVRSWGGEVRLASLLEGHSTTATLGRITGSN